MPRAAAAEMVPPAATAPPRPASLGAMLADLAGGDDDRRYLLLLRFVVINIAGSALVAAAALQGWVGALIAADTTRLVTLIAAVFLWGLCSCGRKIVKVSWEINETRAATPDPASRIAAHLRAIEGREAAARGLLASSLRLKLAAKIGPIRQLAGALVLLGLIGTVVGFMIALAGVDPDTAADAASIGPMVTTLIDGMSVALHTTLVGAVLNIWLMLNARVLESGAVKLVTAIVERGEADA